MKLHLQRPFVRVRNQTYYEREFAMRPLYEIDNALMIAMGRAEEEAEQNEGEISDYLGQLLDMLSDEKDAKVGNICRYIKSLKAEAEMVKTEEKNLADRRRVTENKAESLKRYLAGFMKEGEKFADENSKVSWRKSSSVEIAESYIFNQAPEEWLRVTTAWDKTAIKNDIKKDIEAGRAIPEGVALKEHQNIQIK